MSRIRTVCLAGLMISVLTGAQRPKEETPKTAANFLLQKLNQSRAGAKLIHRSNRFLGALKGQKGVQVAFVIDGTESMGAELDALKKQISAIADNLNEQVDDRDFKATIAIVVYRDAKAPSGRVKLVVPEFTGDVYELTKQLDEVKVETGAPYFDEVVDEGVHAALTKLNWSTQDDISRWIVLCGDAPPYPESTKHRRYSLSELISTARQKQVTVFGLCVNSGTNTQRPELAAASNALQPECSAFFARLAEGTGGKYCNLWDQESLLAELKQKPISVPMAAITEEDVVAARKKFGAAPVIAVLPPAVSGRPQFESGSDSAICATTAQRYLSNLGFSVRGPASLEAEYQSAAASGTTQAIGQLATQIAADFVLSGSVTMDAAKAETQVTLTMYSRKSNKDLATTTATWTSKDGLAAPDRVSTALNGLLQKAGQVEPGALPAQSSAGTKADQDFLSRDLRARRSILSGLYALEKSLSAGGSNESKANALSLLRTSLTELKAASQFEADNPIVELLLAETYYNLVSLGEATDESHRHFLHLQRAYDLRSQPEFAATSWPAEIEGYYALLVEKDIGRAVKVFEEVVAKPGRETGMSALRAHWMLAGLYLGDWDSRVFAPAIVDPEKARGHVLAILAQWPQLAEAEFYRQCLKQSRSGNGEVMVPLTASISAVKSSQLGK